MSVSLKNKYLKICPYGKKQLDFLVSKSIKDTVIILVPVVGFVYAWNGMFQNGSWMYLCESMVLAIYLVVTEVPNCRLKEKENQIFNNFVLYFPRVKHHYRACHHISNAIVNAAEGMGLEMEQLALELYRLLMENNKKANIRSYIENREINRYWKLFLIQAYEASEKGDVCFSENIEHIRMELMEEIYRRKSREYAYTGYVFVTVAPFFMMPVLKTWGLEFTSELSTFYAGTGRFLEMLIFVITIIIYNLIVEAKEMVFLSGKKQETIWNSDVLYRTKLIRKIIGEFESAKGKLSTKIKKLLLQSGQAITYGQLCFQMICYAVTVFLLMAAFLSSGHTREQREILVHVDNMQEIVPVVSDEKRNMLEQYILEITEVCCREKDVKTETVKSLLRQRIRLGNEFTENAVVGEIMKKLHRFSQAKGTIPELLLCFLCGYIAGILPLLRLSFIASMIRKEAEYEVRQFQSLVLMERKNPGVTVMSLLEDMEAFSICYKDVFRHCINSYGFDAPKALLQLKQQGMIICSGFEGLADAFLCVDEVGIEEAFAEIENDRKLLERITRLDMKMSLEKKKDYIDLLVRIPMALAIGAYFILPFFFYSLQGVSEVFELLEEMQI